MASAVQQLDDNKSQEWEGWNFVAVWFKTQEFIIWWMSIYGLCNTICVNSNLCHENKQVSDYPDFAM